MKDKTKGTEDTSLVKRVDLLEHELEKLKNLVNAAKEMLNVEEAAAFMGVTKSFIYKMTYSHAIPFFKPGNKLVYFEKCELLRWLRQNRSMSQSEIEEQAVAVMNDLAKKN